MEVTLITGASGGIGEATVAKLAERKHNLLLIARNGDKLEQQCKFLRANFGIDAQYIAADLSLPGTPEQIFDEVKARGLEVGLLINNAGVGSGGEFSELPLKSQLDLIQLNVSSLVAMTHLFLVDMKARRKGTIVNIASMAAFMPVPYMSTYGASKAFVRSFTEAITQECVPYNVHVMLFSPGLTKTNFNNAAGIHGDTATGLRAEYDSTPTQTPEQVAEEIIRALDKGKQTVVSGALNRLAANMMTFIPNSLITKNVAKQYRKRLKM